MASKLNPRKSTLDGVDLVEVVKRVLTGKATDDDHKIFASFCGRGLRNWQDLLQIYRKRLLLNK